MATEGPLAGFLHFPISISAFISHVFLFLFLSSLEEEKIRRSRRPLSISWLLSHSEFSNQFTLASDLSGNKKVAISRYQSAKLSVGVRVYSPVMTSENVRLKTAVRLFFWRWPEKRKSMNPTQKGGPWPLRSSCHSSWAFINESIPLTWSMRRTR